MNPRQPRTRDPVSPRLTVADRAALADVVDRIARERRPGPPDGLSHKRVARALELSRSTVRRLRNERLGQLSPQLAAKLARLAGQPSPTHPRGGTNWQRLARAIVSADARARLRAYQAWLQERWSRHAASTRGKKAREKQETAFLLSTTPIHALNSLKGHNAIARFEREMRGRGIEENRIRLAVRRILEPFCESGRSGGIERDWDELSFPEKVDYIAAAVRCETILLNRAPATPRAQQVAATSP